MLFRQKAPKRFLNKSSFEDSREEGSSEHKLPIDNELLPPPLPLSPTSSPGNETSASTQPVVSAMPPSTIVSTPAHHCSPVDSFTPMQQE